MEEWRTITNDHSVLSMVNGLVIPFHSTPSQTYIPSTPDWSPAETTALRSEINTLIRIGAVAACEPCDGQFISRIFLVPKADGSSRFILNLKPLNRFVVTHHFKMEDRKTVMRLLSRHCYMATIDLKDAYFMIPLAPSSQK